MDNTRYEAAFARMFANTLKDDIRWNSDVQAAARADNLADCVKNIEQATCFRDMLKTLYADDFEEMLNRYNVLEDFYKEFHEE